MSYFGICTFDLKNANFEDYQTAYADLAKIGFSTTITSDQGKKVVLPTTTTAGQFNGASAIGVRDDLLERVRRAFAARGFSSEIFIFVGGDWAWGQRTT
jgi:hypothetical protein